MAWKKWWDLAICFATGGRRGCEGARPTGLGVHNGKLADCPTSPNCVSSQAQTALQRMEPIPFDGTLEIAQAALVTILQGMNRVCVVSSLPGYIYAEARSKKMGFVDDLEFYLDAKAGLIQFRSAARLGYGDGNVNRQRMEKIIAKFPVS